MIDIRKLKELVRLMVENDLTELNLQDQQETVTVKRGFAGVPMVAPMAVHAPAAGAPGSPAPGGGVEDNGTPATAPEDPTLVAIESPMVGTFYSSPKPDAPAFVTAGASLTPDTVVCLIEAMKVFNEIKAETSGVVERVLVSNGQAVEYGQKLFLVRPA